MQINLFQRNIFSDIEFSHCHFTKKKASLISFAPISRNKNATNQFFSLKLKMKKTLIVSLYQHVRLTTKQKNGKKRYQKTKKKKKFANEELVLNEPLALGSNESRYYVAIFACRWFSILFYIIFTLLANGGRAAFAVIIGKYGYVCVSFILA